MGKSLLEVRDLKVEYKTSDHRRVQVLNGVTLDVFEGETVGVVGESGCGKTTLGRTVVRLLKPTSGQIVFDGRDIARASASALQPLRQQMQLVFQNPFSSLNPRMRVSSLLEEPLITHMRLSKDERRQRIVSLLTDVGMGSEHLDRYPHQLSGGQAQRVALARALALNPKLLVLDEPTSALDVSVQAQIVNLLLDLQQRYQLTYIFISHDLGLVHHISDRIAVMYLGEIVETGACEQVFRQPAHPYTAALLASTPIPVPASGRGRFVLEGAVPGIANPPAGCRFHTRCPHVMDICRQQAPVFHAAGDEQKAACHLLNP